MLSFQSLIDAFAGLLDMLFPIAVALALLFFLWGMATFILAAGDTKRIQEGKDKIKWGLIALFVMVSIWSIVGVIRQDFLGLGSYGPGGSLPVRSRGGAGGGGGTGGGYYMDGTSCEYFDIGTPSCDFDSAGNLDPHRSRSF